MVERSRHFVWGLVLVMLIAIPVRSRGEPAVDDKARQFWSFRPLTKPAVPQPKNAAWVRNPIDTFILEKLEAKGFTPAPPADKTTLIRRATYDLTGLPPTLSEVEGFLKDE